MSERGVFAVDRGIFEHDCFPDEPFTEREAWVWLIGAVVWKAKTVRIGKFVAELDRGQGAFSVRFLADKWQWSKSRVDRFLDRLKNRDMIGTQSETGISVITIRNYDEYQRVSLPERDSSGTVTGTAAGQQRDKEEDIKYIKEKNIPSDDWPKDFREVFWSVYPRKLGKQGALRELERVRRKSVSFVKLISAVRNYAATADPKFTKHPQTWLSKGCWDDELPAPACAATAVTITPTSRSWNAWKAHFRDSGKDFQAKHMDKCASDGKPFTVQSEWPPGMGK